MKFKTLTILGMYACDETRSMLLESPDATPFIMAHATGDGPRCVIQLWENCVRVSRGSDAPTSQQLDFIKDCVAAWIATGVSEYYYDEKTG